jgi:hypothetical protein
MLMRSDGGVRVVHHVSTVEVDMVGRPEARSDDSESRREGEQGLGRDQPSALQGRRV